MIEQKLVNDVYLHLSPFPFSPTGRPAIGKGFLIVLLPVFLLFACSKKEKTEIISQPSEEEVVLSIYSEAVEALKKGDAFYAGKKFKEVESLLPQSEWAAKASLMASYSDYSRNAYGASVFGLVAQIGMCQKGLYFRHCGHILLL